MRRSVRIRGILWNKRKDVMWIDNYWLDDNLSAFYWGGRFDVKFPGVKWVVFDEGTTVSFVQEKVIKWSGVEVVFVLRPLGHWDLRIARDERAAWEKRFGVGEGEEKGVGMERGKMPGVSAQARSLVNSPHRSLCSQAGILQIFCAERRATLALFAQVSPACYSPPFPHIISANDLRYHVFW